MASSLLQFVDSISDTPTVRLDLNDGSKWAMLTETVFPPPPLKQAVASTLLTDGAVIPASVYDLRTITLALTLETATADDTAAELQKLHRELNRPGNILRWRERTTHPVFFRTFRNPVQAVDRYGIPDGRKQHVTVDLLAEPFALGLRENPVSAVTVSTDPAAGSNGCFVDVTGVKGDVEAPAIVRWPTSALADDRQSVFAVRRRGTPSQAPFLIQAEAMTQGTDTTTQPNNASFSGAGNNFSRCTFGTNAGMAFRLSTFTVGTVGVDLRGTYRVLLRYRKSSADAMNLRLRWGDANGWKVVDNDFATPNVAGIIATADLGLIRIPVGRDPVFDSDGTELAAANAFQLRLAAERLSGSGSIDFDFLLLVPADDRFGVVQWDDDQSAPSSDHWILDANDTSAHGRDSSGRVASAGAPMISGGFPMLSPGQTNRIIMLRSVRNIDNWALTTVSPVSVSYFPRYLSVRPPTT